MTFDQVCAKLTRDPWHLTIPQIAELTPYQVRNIYFRSDRRDEPVSAYAAAKDSFWKQCREWRGLSEEETTRLWADEVKKNPALASAL